MKKTLIKFFAILFIIGINTPFNSLIFNNLNKDSLAYGYLCKFSDDSESQKKLSEENCFFCILQNNNKDDCDDSYLSPIIVFESQSQSKLLDNNNFYHSFESFQKTRSPPFIS
tara:strand:- start:356 stop:694 length:339 start_codon:yes stop_codon:yes gene_type:complete